MKGILALFCLGLVVTSLAMAEQAQRADDFVDSLGVNTHFNRSVAPYNNAQVQTLLGQLGVRHIRDDMPVNSSNYSRLSSVYNSYGVGTDWVPYTPGRTPPTSAQLVSNLIANAFFEAIEGPNEPDLASPPYSYSTFTDDPASNNYAGTRAYQNDMFTGVKTNPATGTTPMFSPAMAFSTNAQYLPPILLDFEAMHSYAGGQDPTNKLDSPNISGVNMMTNPPLPIAATECGYHTATASNPPGHPYVSKLAQGKYIPRLYAEYFNRSIVATYIYELVDEGTDLTNKEDNFGIVNYDFTPKAAYTNVQNLATLLKEGRWDGTHKVWNVPSFAPATLDYTLTGSTNKVHHTLLQKSNGEFYLLLWQEVLSFNTTTHTDITNAPASVTLTLNTNIASAATYVLSSLTPTATYTNPASINLGVPDEVLVVRLTPPSILLAQWTFNTGSAADLVSDIGGFTFTEGGTGANMTTTYNPDGTVTLGTGRELMANGLNSTLYPELTSNVTIWARMGLTSNATANAFFLGLMNSNAPSDSAWALVAQNDANATNKFRANYSLNDGTNVVSSTGSLSLVTTGQFFTVALVFDDQAPDTTHLRERFYINGVEVTNTIASTLALQAFQNLAVGRLKASANMGGPLIFDEVRVYNGALTAGEIAAIGVTTSPVANFSAMPTTGDAPLMVSFTDTSTGSVGNWLWDFGDGNQTNFTVATNPSHTYTAGTYTVSLTVIGPGGSNTLTQTNLIMATVPVGVVPLAKWTFSNGDTNDLTSDNGMFTFIETGTGANQTTTFNSGTVTLGTGRELIATNLNSATFPRLTSNATIWARMQMTSNATANAFFLGLMNSNAPADYAWATLVAQNDANATNKFRSFGILNNGTNVNMTSASLSLVTTGQFFTIALVFDDQSPDAAHVRQRFHVNGVEVTNTITSTLALQTFQNLAIGRLKSASSMIGPLIFDEVRIYSNALTTAEIAGIGATPAPAASFSALPLVGTEPLNVIFTDTSTGTITNLVWSLGNGATNTAAGASFTNAYMAGTYAASLTAEGPGGSSSTSTNIAVYTKLQGWQFQYFGCTNCPNANPNADPDGDGTSNTNEFLAGFNPTNSNAYVHITNIAKSGNDIIITYLGASGDTTWLPGIQARTNVLEFAVGGTNGGYTNSYTSTGVTNILSGGTGLGVITNAVDTGGATNLPARYYRVRVLAP